MKCLFLDLASHDALVAGVTANAVAASESVHARVSDAELIPLVENVLKQADWSYEDLTQIACVIGPGGFTSLRVGVTFANVLSDQLGIPAAGIHLSNLYLARVDSRQSTVDRVFWLHSTKKQQLFVRGGMWDEPTLVTTDEIRNTKHEIQNWCGELIDEHRELVDSDSLALKPIREVLPAFLHNLTYQKDLLTPWYGRGW